MLDKNKIFSRTPTIKKVHVKSLNDDIYVKEFIVAERNKIRDTDIKDYQLISLILGICDKDGESLFTIDDIDKLSELPQTVADELLTLVMLQNEQQDTIEQAKK